MAVAPTCYRVADLAQRWSCSPSKIRTLLRDGVLLTLQLGTMIRILITAVLELEARTVLQAASDSLETLDSVPKLPAPPNSQALRMLHKAQRGSLP